jgi:hypothetical protein
MSVRQRGLGTDWHLPLKSGRGFAKRPFMTTPQATGHSVRIIAEEQLTFAEARAKYGHVADVREVLDAYIERGHGDVVMSDWIAPF